MKMGDKTFKLDIKIAQAKSIEEAVALQKATPPPPSIMEQFSKLVEKREAQMKEQAKKEGKDPDKVKFTLSKLESYVKTSRSKFYEIVSGKRTLDRNSIILIGYTAGASLDEMNELLKLAGHKGIYSRETEGAIIMYGLLHGLSTYEVDAELKKNNCTLRFHDDVE